VVASAGAANDRFGANAIAVVKPETNRNVRPRRARLIGILRGDGSVEFSVAAKIVGVSGGTALSVINPSHNCF
jgi:hypothetical protein